MGIGRLIGGVVRSTNFVSLCKRGTLGVGTERGMMMDVGRLINPSPLVGLSF